MCVPAPPISDRRGRNEHAARQRGPDWAGCKEGEVVGPEFSRRLNEDPNRRSLTLQTVRDWPRTDNADGPISAAPPAPKARGNA